MRSWNDDGCDGEGTRLALPEGREPLRLTSLYQWERITPSTPPFTWEGLGLYRDGRVRPSFPDKAEDSLTVAHGCGSS